MLNSVIAVIGTNSTNTSSNPIAMSDVMKDRGAVGKLFTSEGVTLGNSVSDSTGKYIISFDGTLPKTNDPMETVLEAYKSHGEKCLDMFEGSFAFCLWDSKKKKLFVAKDRYGRRPLFYSFINCNQIVFVSQLDALWTFKEPKPNLNMVCNYLVAGKHNHDGETFYEDVKEFLSGYFSFLSTENHYFTQEPYSHYPQLSPHIHRKITNVKAEFSSLLFNTIQKLTPSKGSYATSLSGGLDSTIIASILSRNDETDRHKMYSAVCDGASYVEAEAPYIVEFQRFIQKETKYIKLPLPPSWNELQEFINSVYEPIEDLNGFLFWSIARQAKKDDIKSIFLGTAADAFLFGLKSEQEKYLLSLWKRKEIRIFALELLSMFVQEDYSSGVTNRAISKLRDVIRSSRENYDSKQFLGTKFLGNHFKPAKLWLDRTSITIIDDMQTLDRMFASNGVEPIHPFLDKTLVEYLADLPMDMKVKRGIRKYILRMSAKGLIPEAIRKTKRKFPSPIPRTRWLVEWQPEIKKLMDSEEFKERGFYNTKKIRDYYDRLINGKMHPTQERNFVNQLWRIINVEFWFRQNFG